AHGAQRVRDPEGGRSREPGSDRVGDANRQHGKDHRSAYNLKQWTRRPEEAARLDEGDPAPSHLTTETDDQVKKEDLDPDAEGVGDQILGEARCTAKRGEPEKEHAATEHHVTLDQDKYEL